MAERQFDLTRDTLAVVFLFAMIAASVWILLPFLGAVVWATMIVVATWPMLLPSADARRRRSASTVASRSSVVLGIVMFDVRDIVI